ncbi:Crp/Fnr family transcriptional regulator [filamentous cyanobacterium CCP2]|nr:Crp/Fnr family transcriptional regulator [filamentous cyanobacterium CCP2]
MQVLGTMVSNNFVLDSLPPAEYEMLQPRLEEVELKQGDVLCRVREQITNVYFPTTCLLSWTNSTEMGEMVEVGITGREGVSGVVLLLNEDTSPWQIEVQMPGRAFKLSAKNFITALDKSTILRQRVSALVYLKMVQLNQSALCNRFHSAEERLCRWLLAAQDHNQISELSFTREILAEMIGAGRPTVSIVTGTLQTAGLIRANRGHITILDREGLENVACDCYSVVKGAFDRYHAKRIKP